MYRFVRRVLYSLDRPQGEGAPVRERRRPRVRRRHLPLVEFGDGRSQDRGRAGTVRRHDEGDETADPVESHDLRQPMGQEVPQKEKSVPPMCRILFSEDGSSSTVYGAFGANLWYLEMKRVDLGMITLDILPMPTGGGRMSKLFR